jgi:uncharacterized protein (TIGR03437 family)
VNATDTQLNFPMAIARASNGTLYIADTFNQRIRSVGTDGVIKTVVGTGTPGYGGDTGAATAALISSPYGVAVDSAGNVYFTDTRNMLVRKVSTSGTITKLAGSGVQGYGGDGGNAVDALLNIPTGIVVDSSGNVYVADTQNHRVRKITTDGKIATYAGTGEPNNTGDGGLATSATLYHPQALALDSIGNLYIGDTFNQKVRKVTPAGIITTVAGSGVQGFRGDGGQATSAQLNYPLGLYVDASGVLYIVDSYNSRIRVVTENGVIRTIAGTGKFGDAASGTAALSADLRFPRALVPDGSGGFLLLDTDNSRIRRLTPNPQSPAVSKDGVVSSSAFGGFRTAARGSWLEIYGSNMARETRAWSSSDFVEGKAPTSLAGTSVTIGGQPAYVSYVSPGQVNVQVPESLAAGTYNLVVNGPLGTSEPYTIAVADTQPGLFAPSQLLMDGKQYVGVVLSDGSLASSLVPGQTVTLYGVGFGAVTPTLNAGEIVRSANTVALPLQVYFGDTPAVMTYAGLAPGTLGLYQFNVVVPNVTGTAVPLRFQLNGTPGQQSLYTAVGK